MATLTNRTIRSTYDQLIHLEDLQFQDGFGESTLSGSYELIGDQNISGNKTFSNNIYVSGTGYFKDINISNLSELVLSGTKITIDGNSGVYSSTNIYISGNPVLTGVDLSSYAITTNLILTGSTLDTKINNLSGYVDTQDNSISNNLNTTGSTLQNSINSLSGSSVLLYGDQTIDGTKTFRNSVYIHDLYVTVT